MSEALYRDYAPRHAFAAKVPASRTADDNAEPETVTAHISRSRPCVNPDCHGCATRRAWHVSPSSQAWYARQLAATLGELDYPHDAMGYGSSAYAHRDQNDDS